MCHAAVPGRWVAIRRFVIGCGWRIWRDRPTGRRRFFAARCVAARVGGQVVYSTCSLEPEENERVVADVLAEVDAAHPVSLQSRIEELRREGVLTESGASRLLTCITPEGYLRLLPGAFHTDGFFVATIKKTG